MNYDIINKNEKSKDYCKADYNNVYCFFITIFSIPAFFRFPDVTEGWYGQQKYCCKKAEHVVMISFAIVFGLLVFSS